MKITNILIFIVVVGLIFMAIASKINLISDERYCKIITDDYDAFYNNGYCYYNLELVDDNYIYLDRIKK